MQQKLTFTTDTPTIHQVTTDTHYALSWSGQGHNEVFVLKKMRLKFGLSKRIRVSEVVGSMLVGHGKRKTSAHTSLSWFMRFKIIYLLLYYFKHNEHPLQRLFYINTLLSHRWWACSCDISAGILHQTQGWGVIPRTLTPNNVTAQTLHQIMWAHRGFR